MGSFPGHALPGSFFIVVSLWWTVNIVYYFNKARWTGQTYLCRSNFMLYRQTGPYKVVPVEAIFKIIFAVVGILGEFIWALKYDFGLPVGNAQHMTMFAFFGISGMCDVIAHYKRGFVPPNIDYVAIILAFLVEALLFNFHLHGRSSLDATIHSLLVYTILSSAILIGVESIMVNNALVSLTKALSLLVHGTWFWQIGFILYSPSRVPSSWHAEDQDHIFLAVLVFVWHVAFNIAVIAVTGVTVTIVQRRLFHETSGYRAVDISDSQFSRTMFLGKEDVLTDESDSS
ncbi:transmembrane protein 45B-like [Mizuhopecten yessoensis]|uniref:Transmembrane protein 45B n=1 Tax=Mizuhopecten yessoensis TaxID=6573 RepID=A0A210Q4A9_MIZYE|nr:transmembrane protein 45B-like [Mizuhopecten yessoensis]XP_021367629.1 transmembrane protein 45B-like [Mizuhopecten yessoensis]OWF43519.1 Transmembrane protein 45B [Mizuhopecten yessoensis]